jgi:hypothetical protein
MTCRTIRKPLRESIADRISTMLFLNLTAWHPDCQCSSSIYSHPCCDDPIEVEFSPCVKDGPTHDSAMLESVIREQWERMNDCAASFVMGHELHPECEEEEAEVVQ